MPAVRIIGGQWRSRQIHFVDMPGLRPTQDRIRETLFNWLTPFIVNACCLDLFAGSGVLGFEALSRGASFSCFVENNRQAVIELRNNAEKLAINPQQFAIVRGLVPHHLPTLPQAPFDIVFLDPPFHQNLLTVSIAWLVHSQLVRPGAIIYLEMEKDLDLILPKDWEIYRRQATATLIYQLVRVKI